MVPVILEKADKISQRILKHSVDSLSLAISLKMEGCGYVLCNSYQLTALNRQTKNSFNSAR